MFVYEVLSGDPSEFSCGPIFSEYELAEEYLFKVGFRKSEQQHEIQQGPYYSPYTDNSGSIHEAEVLTELGEITQEEIDHMQGR